MSRHDWLRRTAVRGCLIAILIAPFTGLGQEDKPADQPKAEQAGEAINHSAPESPMLTTNGPQPTYSDWAKPNCDNPQKHEEADLCVQRRMAKAAEDTVMLNGAQIVIGFFTLAGLVLTVIYARKAANAAIEAAEHGRTAALAGVDAARAAEVTAQAVLRIERARLRLDIPFGLGWRVVRRKIAIAGRTSVLDEEDHKFDIRFGFKNYGKTPATIHGIRASIGYYSEYPERNIPDDGTAIFIVPAETVADKEWSIVGDVSSEEWDRAENNDGFVLFVGAVIYRDVFDVRWKTYFCWEYEWTRACFILSPNADLNCAT